MYLGVVTEDSAYTGSPGGQLHAIDMSNGRSRWSLPLKESRSEELVGDAVQRGLGRHQPGQRLAHDVALLVEDGVADAGTVGSPGKYLRAAHRDT